MMTWLQKSAQKPLSATYRMGWVWLENTTCRAVLYDFIAEHHGTLVTRYQYNRAVQAADGDASKVDESWFRYPGPSPRSKETAILMFADGVEARARAERPRNDDEVRTLVRNVIERCQKDDQLDRYPALPT